MPDDKKNLLQQVKNLEDQLRSNKIEVVEYRQKMLGLSHQIDEMIAMSQLEVEYLKQLHRQLVPTAMPNLNGFEFSRKYLYGTEQGSDYFDVFVGKDKLDWSILMSTAPNYTVSAALLTKILKYSEQFSNISSQTPSQFKSIINLFCEELKQDKLTQSDFKTEKMGLFFAHINRRNLMFEFACLGEMAGFVVHPKQNVIKILSAGSKKNDLVHSIVISLEPTTKVCIVSTGILESINTQGLAQILQLNLKADVHSIRNEILYQCQKHTGLEQPRRDQTVFVFEVQENIIKLA